jgi:integrase
VLDLFPSERGTLASETGLNRRFNRYCKEVGFSPGPDIHSLRRSYITHLIEAGNTFLVVLLRTPIKAHMTAQSGESQWVRIRRISPNTIRIPCSSLKGRAIESRNRSLSQ